MEKDLLARLKKLLKKEGRLVVVDESGKDAFVMQSLDDYEDGSGECDCCHDHDEDFEDEEWDDDINDEELMKKVNADIAKWREDQEKDGLSLDVKEEKVKVSDEKPDETVSEEEKYYLEPLE